MSASPVGKTKDAGWQIGVSRTVPHRLDDVWSFLISLEGLGLWLGELDQPLVAGSTYRTSDGTSGEVRSLRPGDRVRVTWQPFGRPAPATVQIAVVARPTGTSIRFHTERLADAEERERMRSHWKTIAERIEQVLAHEV